MAPLKKPQDHEESTKETWYNSIIPRQPGAEAVETAVANQQIRSTEGLIDNL